MIKVLIVGDRAEGKTVLGITIKWLLEKFTNYKVEYEETGEARDWFKKRLKRHLEETDLKTLKEKKKQSISLQVINTLF